MRKLLITTIAGLLFLCLAMTGTAQQRKSPHETTSLDVGGAKITITYGRPYMKGRKIFGGLVPYGQVWRTGANDATTLVTDTNVRIGDKDVPAGSYTLFTVPNADKWTLIISKKTGEWGIPYPGEGEDFVRVDMRVSQLPSPVENFTIGFDQTGSTCAMHVDWETTRAGVDISEKK